jgi:hypothetical protein
MVMKRYVVVEHTSWQYDDLEQAKQKAVEMLSCRAADKVTELYVAEIYLHLERNHAIHCTDVRATSKKE